MNPANCFAWSIGANVSVLCAVVIALHFKNPWLSLLVIPGFYVNLWIAQTLDKILDSDILIMGMLEEEENNDVMRD